MRVIAVLAIVLFATPVAAQQATASAPPPPGVYLDCRADCDDDLIRTEITFVNWLRERLAADVHLLITEQDAGAGGEQFTLAFIGQRALAGRGDTLTFTTDPTTTEDEERRGLLRTIALGLVQFAARTTVASTLRVEHEAAPEREHATQVLPSTDPWNAWVFEIELSGSTEGERSIREREFEAGIGANRTTEAWKLDLELEFSYQDDRRIVQDFDDQGNPLPEETFTSLVRNWNTEVLLVKSITGHWSAGVRADLGSNTFNNQRRSLQITPAIEYNIFPYSESTRRELVLQYGMGYQSFRYSDSTIFDRISETLPVHYLEAFFATRQPWGSTSLRAEHRNYLTDASKRSTEVNGEISVRLFRGFSINFGGSYSWIRDQIYLPKGSRDPIDVLLRRRELLTGFEYDARVGFSYTFGSIFNNVVNPRF
ncbi:MAG TPA: hypothetical protein VF178_03490 [Gemmatimonadaceae bacterium]